MIGIFFIVIAGCFGGLLSSEIIGPKNRRKGQNNFWVLLAASWGTGILFLTWMVYILAYIFYTILHYNNPLLPANVLVMGVTAAVLLLYWIRNKIRIRNFPASYVSDGRLLKKEIVYYSVLAAFITFTMWYVFHVKNGYLYSGFTVYGDYAPHTAMMRSFSRGTNFPTQYPHFGGEDIKYHFMFQFLVGNLEYLGLRIDLAYNLVSVLALTGLLMILSQIAYRLSGKFKAEIFCAVLFFFRSGTAFFQFIAEHLQAGDLAETILENKSFIGYTPNENWGLWNYNVYLNQRHLAFGLLLAAFAVYMFLEWVFESDKAKETGIRFFSDRWITKNAWKPKHPWKACMLGIVLGLSAFWNGAALIGCLLILMGFAVFSDGKFDFVLTAAFAILLSVIQTKTFITGEGIKASFYWGFICEDKSIPGVLLYLFRISGITVMGCGVLALFLKRYERSLLLSFLLPVFFAFTGSLTPDITVNHKYIMISWAFLTVFWAQAVAKIAEGGYLYRRFLAVVLMIGLTATGIYDFVVVLRGNAIGRRVAVSMNSTLTEWLCENLTSEDLILTPEYSMNEVTMSGVMMYMGWPYYAWSAGYDTYYRADAARKIYTTKDEAELRQLVSEEQIDYILYEEDMTFEEAAAIEDTIKAAYELVYTSDDGRIRIYEAE